MRGKGIAARVAIAASVIAGTTLLGAPAAQAYPGNCSAYIASNEYGYGVCTSGTGEFRIGIPCKLWYGAYTAWSSWRNVGSTASVGCGFGARLWTEMPGGPHVVVEKRD